MADAAAPALRLVRDRSLWISARADVVAGGSPWRLSRVAELARPVLARLASDGWVVVTGAQESAIGRAFVARGYAHPVVTPAPGPHAVTVVVPAYGRPEALERSLQALAGLDVIVVDDGTPQADLIPAIAERHGARCVRLDVNSGPGAARNRGLRDATTDLVAFVDSDCTPEPGWLDVLVPHFQDRRVALAAPRVLPRGSDDRVLAQYERASSALDMGRHPALVRPGARLGFLPTATVLVRRSAMLPAPFDESLRLGEDVDLVWRLADDGHLLRYEPAATVRHDPPPDWSSWARRRFQYGTSAVPLEQRHEGRLTPLRMSPWNAAAIACVVAGQPLLALGTATVSTGLLARRLRRADIGADVALQMGLRGLAADTVALGRALRREHWPIGALALAASPVSRPARLLAATMVAPVVADWLRERPALDLLRYTGVRLAADAAYGSGVLVSCLRHRDARALKPRFHRREAGAAQARAT